MKNKILLINGSLNGTKGQSHTIAKSICSFKAGTNEYRHLTLKDQCDISKWKEDLAWAEGFVFLTGTYWDSWGSPLQDFFEKTTDWEVSSLWLGKPAGVIVTMHSVGGKSVLSRMQGVLNTLGLIIPPLCGLVYSLNTHLISENNDHAADFWHLDEVPLILENIQHQIEINQTHKPTWSTWKVDRKDVSRPWL